MLLLAEQTHARGTRRATGPPGPLDRSRSREPAHSAGYCLPSPSRPREPVENHGREDAPGPPPRLTFARLARVLAVLLCWAVGAVVAAPSYVWVLEPVVLPAGPPPAEAILQLETAAGEIVASSRECRLLGTGEETRVCGRIQLARNGAFILKLLFHAAAGKPVSLVLNREFALDAGTPFDVVLMLDSSYSMRKNDPGNLRVEAVRQFHALARNSPRISNLALLTFRNDTKVLLPLTPPAAIADITPYLKRLTPMESTNFNEPFQKAAEMLLAPSGRRRAVLFLSDGEPVVRYRDTHRLLQNADCPVYTIGLSKDAAADLLSRMAKETGGQYFHAQTADQLRPFFTTIFQALARPATVLKQLVPVAQAATVPFWMDESMHNTVLAVAPASGTVRVALDDTFPAGTEPLSGLAFCPVPGLALGRHELRLTGSGRVSCEITADTSMALQAVALHEQGPPGLPLEFAFFLRGAEQLQNVRFSCEVRDPDLQLVPFSLASTPFGLSRGTSTAVRKPGRYSVLMEARGTLASGEVYRQANLYFQRTGEVLPEARTAAPATPSALQAQPLSQASAPLPVTAAQAVVPGTASAATTFWASQTVLALPTLYPGDEQRTTVDILINSAGANAVTFALDPPSAGGLTCEVTGNLSPNRKSQLALTVRAAGDSAGQRYAGTLVVRAGGENWSLPVSVAVAVPAIQVQAGLVELQLKGDNLEARQTLTLSLTPRGTCELRMACDEPRLTVSPAAATVAQKPQAVTLQLSTPPPPVRQTLAAKVRVTGPGLAPVDVPVSFELKPVAKPRLAASPATPSLGLSWQLLAAVLLLLLVLLLIAILRGNRRAVYILISLVVHVLLLFLVVPEADKRKSREGSSTASLSLGGSAEAAIVEERIAPEAAVAASATPATPAPADSSKSETAPVAEAADAARNLVPETVPQTAPATAAATPETVAKRDALSPQEIAAQAAAEAARKHASAVTEQAERLETAGERVMTEARPIAADTPQTVPVTEAGTSAAAAAPAPQLAATQAALGRETLQPQTLTAASLPAAAARRREAAAGNSASAASPTASATAATGTATLRLDTVVESRTLQEVPGASAASRPAVAATPQPLATAAVPRPGLQNSDISQAPGPETLARKTVPVAAAGMPSAERPVASAAVPAPGSLAPMPTPGTEAAGKAGLPVETAPATGPVQTAELKAPGLLLARASTKNGEAPGAAMLADVPSSAGMLPVRRQDQAAGAADGPRARDLQTPAGAVATAKAGSGKPAAQALTIAELPIGGTRVPGTAPVASPPAAVRAASATLSDVSGGAAAAVTQPRPRTAAAPGLKQPAEALTGHAAPAAGFSGSKAAPRPVAGRTMAVAEATGPSVLAAVHAQATPAAVEPHRALAPAVALAELPGTAAEPRKVRLAAGPASSGSSEQGAAATVAKPQPATVPPAKEKTAAATLLPVADINPLTSRDIMGTGSVPQLPGATDTLGSGDGRWRTTFPNLQYQGDWDCDKTAMLNLAHQFQKRTGSTLPFDSRTVNPRQGDLPQAPFMFMSGHSEFTFTPDEVRRLREYVRNGGFLWINDSTDIGDETYDRAVRRELARLFPEQKLEKLSTDHPIFQAPYDLTRGFRGYKVPPGDKYRLDYLEGLKSDGRTAVIYTRNDYGDGLEIDARTHPLMASLTDLSPEDMQEGATEMGINIAMYCLNRGRVPAARETAAALPAGGPEADLRTLLKGKPQTPVAVLEPATAWSTPTDWGGHVLPTKALPVARPEPRAPAAVTVEFATAAGQAFKGWASQAVLGRDCDLQVSRQQLLLLDVGSPLTGGARLAVALKSKDVYYESAPVYFRPGQNRDLIIDLRGKNFKTAASNWQYTAALPDNLQATQFYLILFPQQPSGRLEIRNLRTVRP